MFDGDAIGKDHVIQSMKDKWDGQRGREKSIEGKHTLKS